MAEPDTERGEAVSKAAPAAKPAKKARPKRAAAPARKKPKAPPPHHPGHGWLWAALVAVAILNGGAIATVWLMEAATQRADIDRIETHLRSEMSTAVVKAADEQLATIKSQVSALAERVDQIPDRASAKETEAAMALLAEKVDGLTERIATLEKSRAAAQTSGTEAAQAASDVAKRNAEELATLKERLDRLESKQAAEAPAERERKQALVVAVGQLREALTDSKPFTDELDTVTKLGGDTVREMTAAIAPFADSGIPTADQLKRQFQDVEKKILAAAATPQKGDWIDKAISQATSVVTVRKVGPVEGDTPEAICSRAEARLKADDLQGAVDELAALKDAPAAAAEAWLKQARARLASRSVMRDLQNHVIGQIAQTDGPAQ